MKKLMAVMIGLGFLLVGGCAQTETKPQNQQQQQQKKGIVVVVMETEMGTVEIAVEAEKSPNTAANFLKYVDGKFYDGGSFNRTVTMENQGTNPVKIEVIQGAMEAGRRKEGFGAIKLERTSETGLKHKDGTISMARGGADSATSRS